MPGREADSGLIGQPVRAERAGGITCIRTGEGFLYPGLLTDLRSRKTAGCHAGDTLEAKGLSSLWKRRSPNFRRAIPDWGEDE